MAQNELHFNASSTGMLYYNSAFAHGYRHGYEEGFHAADLDLQLGREAREVAKISEFQHDKTGYRPGFGDKRLFRAGYREGFRLGYQDAISGGEFRATERVQVSAAGLTSALKDIQQRFSFDEGFFGGYQSARSQVPPVAQVTLDYLEQYCEKTPPAHHPHPIEYCSGYSRGYMLGRADIGAPPSNVIARQVGGH